MMNEQNNQELSTNSQASETNPQTKDDRLDYMNQKPHYNRKELTILGVVLVAVLAFIIGGTCFVASNAHEAFMQSDFGQSIIGDASKIQEEVIQEAAPDSRPFSEELVVNNPDKENADDDYPEYTKESIALALYYTPLSDRRVVTTSADEEHAGHYILQPNTSYAICWDASPLYRNNEGKVDADITISSDFLIGGGIDGEGVITVSIRDCHRHIDYVGELHIASDYDNLGIEFCADQCRKYGYGHRPQIDDKEFTVCFYTSGEYVEQVTDGTYSVEGHYGFNYGTDGNALLNYVVTRRPVVKPVPEPSATPMPDGGIRPTPMPQPEIDYESRPAVDPVPGVKYEDDGEDNGCN